MTNVNCKVKAVTNNAAADPGTCATSRQLPGTEIRKNQQEQQTMFCIIKVVLIIAGL